MGFSRGFESDLAFGFDVIILVMAEVIVNISEPIPKPMPRLPPSGFIKRLYCFSIRTAAIAHIHRVIQAIRIRVMPENALAGGEEDIGGNKPADFGVIVPALEVVETCLLVIDISTVTEGIILSECGSE